MASCNPRPGIVIAFSIMLLVAWSHRARVAQAGPTSATSAEVIGEMESLAPTRVGTPAPDVMYLSTPYGWRHLRELEGPRGLVLVMDPTDADLTALERSRPALDQQGIEPVAVLREPDGTCWRRLTHLGLSYSLPRTRPAWSPIHCARPPP